MISLKQSGFYITAAFPVFSIAFSLLIRNQVNELLDKIVFNIIVYKRLFYTSFSLLILSLLLNLFFANTIQRDHLMLNDVCKVITVVPENSTISIANQLRNNWSLHGYFQRYGYISLDRNTNINHRYKLVNGKLDLLPGYQKLELNLNTFTLYEKL
jgi:hypothetical protein